MQVVFPGGRRGGWAGVLFVLLACLSLAAPASADAGRAAVNAYLDVDRVTPGGSAVVAVVLDVADGYYAQSHRPFQDFLIPFTLSDLQGGAPGRPVYPEGRVVHKPAIAFEGDGNISVYAGRTVMFVPVEVGDVTPGETFTVTGVARFQICDDDQCFMPETASWSVSVPVAADGDTPVPTHAELFEGYAGPVEAADVGADDEAALRAIVGDDSTQWTAAWALLMALTAGLIFNVMPCVLPVLPLKAWGFYEVANHDRGKCFGLGLVFAAGMVAIFTLLGLLILPLQVISWGSMFANPYFVWPLVGLLVVLSFALFGTFNVGLPSGVYGLVPRHDTFSGNFSLGMLTAVLATPCTAPLLPALLIWAAAQSPVLGVLSLSTVGVGMAMPYVLLSLFPQAAKRFPRTGPWPELFKQLMGFLMLAAAAYFAGGRLMGSPEFWWLPVAVVATGCLFMVVRTAQLSGSAGPVGVTCALAVTAVFASVAFTPLASTFTGAGTSTRTGFATFDDATFESAKAEGRPVLVKFTANWCLTCQAIERTVFTQDRVWQALDDKGVLVLKVDLTNSGVPGEPLLLELNPSGGIPLTAVWIPGRDEPVVLSSIYTGDQLLRLLELIR